MNLLIVDDEIVTTQVLEEQLDRALLSIDQIYVAYNTSMARDILQKNKVELILCDIEMPKENGIHFLEWVREQKIQTEVIFLTSHEKFEYAYGAVQNGAANYLLKPIDMNKINQALLREKEASGHILDEDYILQCLNKGSRVSTLEYLQKTLQHVKQTMHSVEGFRNFQVELTQLVSKYLHDKKENMNSVIRDPIYLKLDMNAVKSEFSMVQWMTWLMNKVFDLTQEERKEKTEKRITDQVIDYIREHYTEDINRNTLSERFHFSPEYIGKMFRKDIGTSLNDYINSLRVEKAKHLLENTNTKVIDIALEVGFDTLPYFSSVFKKYTGVSPAEFRKKE